MKRRRLVEAKTIGRKKPLEERNRWGRSTETREEETEKRREKQWKGRVRDGELEG
jgi:hypothetical protein